MGIPQRGIFSRHLCHPLEASLLEGQDVFRLKGDSCPYFPDGRIRESLNFVSHSIDPAVYEGLLAFGWRRCGLLFYKNLCTECESCLPIRVDSALFRPDRSMRRCLAANEDMLIEAGEPGDFDEDFELFSRYCSSRHADHSSRREEFRLFLSEPPLPSIALRHRLPGGRLACVAWTDILAGSLSAVYTAFDPEMPKRGLGVFSILTQIELCRRLKKRHLQLGFYIKGCRKMSYKDRYKPFQHAGRDGVWVGHE